MSGFVCQPSVVPADLPAAEAIIANDGFFPDVDPAPLRKQARINPAVLFDRLREAVLAAMIALEEDLRCWKATQIADGHATLAAVPALQLGTETRLQILYRRALTALVRAELVERQRDLDTTGAGDRQLDAMAPSVDELRRDAAYAVRDMLGRPRINAELI